MPQLIALAIAGAGLYAGYKWLGRELRRLAEAAERARAEAGGVPKEMGALEWDEQAGVYRPGRRR